MTYYALGLMSGTSLDGLDICYASFKKDISGKWHFAILNAITYPYDENWTQRLRNSIDLTAEELYQLNAEYGFYLGQKVHDFIKENSIENLDVIGSHGHTVFHQPSKKFTVQIGDGRAIKILNDFPVVYDFRSQDVLLGGNGAPLVPIGDYLLFSEFDSCLNIGGFSNISFQQNNKRTAFDICAVNIVLNKYAQKLGKEFDENGAFARSGTIDNMLLQTLNNIEFYSDKTPKSLGVEWVLENIAPLLENKSELTVLATFTEHAAMQIAKVFNENNLKNVFITGGGIHNKYLLERIKNYTSAKIVIPEDQIIDYKEALIFAFMGVLRMNNEINILSSATGSSHDHCAGILV